MTSEAKNIIWTLVSIFVFFIIAGQIYQGEYVLPIVLIIAIAVGLFFLSKSSNRQVKIIIIKEFLMIEKWEKLKEKYVPTEVDKKRQEILPKYANLESKSKEELTRLHNELILYFGEAEQYFALRLDTKMLELAQKISDLITDKIFKASKQEITKESIAEDIEKFSDKDYENFTEEDFKEIKIKLDLYSKILEQPYDFFDINYTVIHAELEKISSEIFWISYDLKYTKASVQALKNEFEVEYNRIFAISDEVEKQKNMLRFYMGTFRAFLVNPQPPLILKPRRIAGASSYSSSSSYSDYSFSSSSYFDTNYSSYSDSYSDFGGGSFGGGGADGDW